MILQRAIFRENADLRKATNERKRKTSFFRFSNVCLQTLRYLILKVRFAQFFVIPSKKSSRFDLANLNKTLIDLVFKDFVWYMIFI